MAQPNILVIGCGSIGDRHIRCFQRVGRAALTVCDADPALAGRIGLKYDLPWETDWNRAMDSGRFDATVICTPAHLHVRMALESLRAGAHTLIEKPLSQSRDGVDELLNESVRSGLKAGVAYVYHFFPYLSAARQFLETRVDEPVLLASYVGGQPFHLLRPGYAQTYYRDRRTGGGAIQDALTHVANWIESVLGPTESVLCDCAHLALPDVQVEDTVNLAARHHQALASYSLNQFQSASESTLQLHTANCSVKIELDLERWGYRFSGDSCWSWHDTPVTDYDICFMAQANAFLDWIEGQPSQVCSLEAAVRTLEFNMAALASAEKGQRILCREMAAT